MKYEIDYNYAFDDNAAPKRHTERVVIKTTLRFELPDVPNDDRDFEARTGTRQDRFEQTFQAMTEKAIDAAYKEKVKAAAQVCTAPAHWKAWVGKFEKNQVAYVEDLFTSSMQKLAKVAVKLMPDVVTKKTLAPADACALYLQHFPPKFTVAGKFYDDHMVKAISTPEVHENAIARFKKNQRIKVSSWIELSEATVKNKASSGKKIAHVYNNAQQLGVTIKARQWTATISESSWKPGAKGKQPKETIAVKIQSDVYYIEIDIAKDDNLEIFVMGQWDPQSGQAEIYHYEANPPGAHTMLDKHRKWFYNETTKEYTAPA